LDDYVLFSGVASVKSLVKWPAGIPGNLLATDAYWESMLFYGTYDISGISFGSAKKNLFELNTMNAKCYSGL